MLIEVHLIQTFHPSNLNRDDTGNPKDAVFGGERRVRISSQAQKRPIRLSAHFQETIATGAGLRTKTLASRVSGMVSDYGIPGEQAMAWAQSFIGQLSKLDAKKKDEPTTAVLLYVSPAEEQWIAQTLAQLASTHAEVNEDVIKKTFADFAKAVKGRTSAPDIAMFGRMLADKPELNIDAACQIAHALSTHQATTEFDYFTAVDDLQKDDTSGAGMIGLTPFTSATFYRYARIDWEKLVNNLGGDAALARRTVEGFLGALVFALPSGKQNTFASHPTPDFLLGIVRPDQQGWSLANAFEQPVRARNGSGFVKPSIERLVDHWRKQERTFRLKLPTAVAILNASEVDLSAVELDAEEAAVTANCGHIRNWIEALVTPLAVEA